MKHKYTSERRTRELGKEGIPFVADFVPVLSLCYLH